MARSSSILHRGLSGSLGKLLVFKKYGDKIVVTKMPDMSRRKLSTKQKQVNEMMAEANYEARTIMADEELRAAAQVRLNVTSNRLYTALIKEYFARERAAKESRSKKK